MDERDGECAYTCSCSCLSVVVVVCLLFVVIVVTGMISEYRMICWFCFCFLCNKIAFKGIITQTIHLVLTCSLVYAFVGLLFFYSVILFFGVIRSLPLSSSFPLIFLSLFRIISYIHVVFLRCNDFNAVFVVMLIIHLN